MITLVSSPKKYLPKDMQHSVSVQLYSVLHGSSYAVLGDGLLSIHSDKGYMLLPPQNCVDVKFAGGVLEMLLCMLKLM